MAKRTPEQWAQAWENLGKTKKEDSKMNYVSDCCGVSAIEGTLNTWTDFDIPFVNNGQRDYRSVVYGTCSKCCKPSLFGEGE